MRLRSVSKLAGYCRGACRCDLGSEYGPRKGWDDRLASSDGNLSAMILQRLPGNFNQEYTLTKKVRNEVRLSEIDGSDLKKQ